jgi:hypothetical protein
MAQHLNENETRNEYVQRMGPDLGQLQYELFCELSHLHFKWGQYRELFGKNRERIDLLNKVAPVFFGYLQRTLFEDILLHLTRLTDPPQLGRHDNLTVKRLPSLIQDQGLKARVGAALQDTINKCKFARDWRDRRVAHADLLTYRKQHPQPLALASHQKVEEVLAAMRKLLNCVDQHYRNSEVGYEFAASELGATGSLVRYLTLGLQAQEEKSRRRRRGSR